MKKRKVLSWVTGLIKIPLVEWGRTLGGETEPWGMPSPQGDGSLLSLV